MKFLENVTVYIRNHLPMYTGLHAPKECGKKTERQEDEKTLTRRQKDKKTKMQKTKRVKDKDQEESLVL